MNRNLAAPVVTALAILGFATASLADTPSGIRRLDLTSIVIGDDAWDELTVAPGMLYIGSVPASSDAALLVLAICLLGIGRRIVTSSGGHPGFARQARARHPW